MNGTQNYFSSNKIDKIIKLIKLLLAGGLYVLDSAFYVVADQNLLQTSVNHIFDQRAVITTNGLY
jgi:hypothetical protein